MFYIFHGEDELSRTEEVARLKALIAQEAAGDLNLTVLDGRRLSLAELMNACNALPFLSGRRLVIVHDFLQRLSGRKRPASAEEEAQGDSLGSPNEETAALLAYLPHLPPTTRLVFVESAALPPSHPMLKYAQGNPQGHVRAFPLLNPRQEEGRRGLAAWIRRRAKEKGVEITAPAVAALIELIGGDLRALDQELEKLAAHAAYERAITLEDVRALTSAAQEANIFDLMDTLGLRQRKKALALTARLFAEGANELYLLTMIARQVRLILLVKELAEKKHTPSGEIAKSLSLRPFMVT
ncbi:MAG: DNA polymerase III subunit delta, partial [Chloroflexi bacterium]|nr:DNA polymerase III subunit delta [Chloroflexota bacterium]